MNLSFLYRQIDNAPLILFRIFFGLLLACESFGAIFTGWVYTNMVEPKFTFSHIGMEWLQPLPGNGMYYYFMGMGILGILIMVGLRYRLSLLLFTILWAGAYFMQKTAYNNHYYLLMLVCFIMLFLPANRYASADVMLKPSLKRQTMPAWCSYIMIFQVAIVYFFATIAKFYPGWLDGSFTSVLLRGSLGHHLFDIAYTRWFPVFIAYAGIFFDLLVIPLLLFRKTRTIALLASLIFHMFNSATLNIGIFPFFALSFVVFFYPPNLIRRRFFPGKREATVEAVPVSAEGRLIVKCLFIPYFIIQVLLPLRHHLIKGDVLWTEEGHRLSWRMMLRFRNGVTHFRVVDKATGQQLPYADKELTDKQRTAMHTKPDMIWQMAQRIHKEYLEKGKDVAVYADTRCGINKEHWKILIDPSVDLAAAPWDYFFHSDWILLYNNDETLEK